MGYRSAPSPPMSDTTPQEDSPSAERICAGGRPESAPIAPAVASVTLAMRSTREFPADPSPLSRGAAGESLPLMRSSHSSLSRSRGQLLRRSKEFSLARQRFLETLRTYEERLSAIGREKVEAMEPAQELHRELVAFEGRQQALDRILSELDEAKERRLLGHLPHPRTDREDAPLAAGRGRAERREQDKR